MELRAVCVRRKRDRRWGMECHKCKWAAKIKQWEHEGVKFEDTPCARCSLVENSNYTRPFETEAADALQVKAEAGGPRPEIIVDEVPDTMPISVLADAVRLLMSLPRDALEVVRLRYGGMPYAEIAEMLGKNVDAVEKQHERMIVKNPALGALLPVKVSKKRLRQRRRRKELGSCSGECD